ncbi:nucleotidyltransferase domain-containing protein [Paenibacillus tianjinensis]|uniref:Nucleotidyltransferase domain-containing protein n=1 Tax=Paenibacillus tianjinensis TaxID=2810347 RepID=A0ABX7LHN0_9BACL|nr:nucleotidyltransferase domain-containing protein [Paenibacillus tianjinensis]QSF47604.1 nucleotidyltransferase domain-containing protein [Paenibacillus tianjinensis]
MSEIHKEIVRQLRSIEAEENVRILYACESGSRAWGFPSKDSDYDVRFLYLRRPEAYLSILEPRDVIERPISDLLDINGWDLKKGLTLFRKSNPPLLEWLQSCIRYEENYTVAESIRKLSPLGFSPKSCIYHYLNMARGNYRTYLQGSEVKIKKYFYVLRPLLACAWIEKYNEVPPLEFSVLVEELIPAGTLLRETVNNLLIRKMSGDELNLEPRLEVINTYLEQQIAYFEEAASRFGPGDGVSYEVLDELFRAALAEVWGEDSLWTAGVSRRSRN